MPREIKPIEDEELAGLIMAMTAEAQRAGWTCRYGIQSDGSLVMHVRNPRKRFSMVTAGRQNTADNGRQGHLVIVSTEVTAAEQRPAGDVTADQQAPADVTAGDLPPSWGGGE